MAIINGTPSNDALNGTAGRDAIAGFEGNDVLFGLNDNDELFGGMGNDNLFGGDGNDYLDGADGADTLNGGTGADRMDGEFGDDTYIVDHVGDVAKENFSGVPGGVDTVYSTVSHTLGLEIEHLTLANGSAINGTGNALGNVLTGNAANNVLSGLDGDDTLSGNDGNDALNGGNGIDYLDGWTGNDLLNGGAGADLMEGGAGNDTYVVDHVGDVAREVFAEDGVDTVQASVTYTLNTSIEHFTLTGSSAINGTGNALNNILTGNSANNVLSGLDGNDTLNGNSGNDTLNGGNGNDVLTGGSGRDQLNGGAGNDRFDYNAVNESPTSTGHDVITGFAGAGTALGDQIDLRDIDANTLAAGNQAFTWKGATPGGAGTLWYSGGVLYGNVDGDATPEFQIQLVGAPALVVGGPGTDILL